MSVQQAVRNPRSYAVRLLAMYRALLFDPETFYEEYVKRPGISREAVLVGLIGAIGTLGAYYAYTQVTAGYASGLVATGPTLSDDTNLQLYRRVVNPLAGAYALWLLFTVALYAVSWLYSGVGSFFRLLKNTAWGLVPIAFANVLNAAAWAGTAYLNRQEYQDVPERAPNGFPEEVAAFVWDQVASEPAVVATTVVGLVFVVWSGYICAHGVARMRDIEISEAYRVAAVPTLAYVLWVANELLGIV